MERESRTFIACTHARGRRCSQIEELLINPSIYIQDRIAECE
jgi:hypothetical protein